MARTWAHSYWLSAGDPDCRQVVSVQQLGQHAGVNVIGFDLGGGDSSSLELFSTKNQTRPRSL